MAICASPRGEESQTAAMTRALLEEAGRLEAAVEFIDLGGLDIKFCTACGVCHKEPRCELEDDANAIIRRMLEVDAIVLATPNYLNHVAAPLKALLDRTSHFIHCLRLEGKYIASVSTSGGGSGDQIRDFIAGYSISVGAQYVGTAHSPLPLGDAAFEEARKLGAALVQAVREETRWPEQIEAIEAHRARFARGIAMHKEEWSMEYTYWKEKGWLE